MPTITLETVADDLRNSMPGFGVYDVGVESDDSGPIRVEAPLADTTGRKVGDITLIPGRHSDRFRVRASVRGGAFSLVCEADAEPAQGILRLLRGEGYDLMELAD